MILVQKKEDSECFEDVGRDGGGEFTKLLLDIVLSEKIIRLSMAPCGLG
jgi:hypothetical protein